MVVIIAHPASTYPVACPSTASAGRTAARTEPGGLPRETPSPFSPNSYRSEIVLVTAILHLVFFFYEQPAARTGEGGGVVNITNRQDVNTTDKVWVCRVSDSDDLKKPKSRGVQHNHDMLKKHTESIFIHFYYIFGAGGR